jgi:hypothetical protein
MKKETLVWTVLLIAGGLFLAYRVAAIGAGRVYVQTVDGQTKTTAPRERLTEAASFSVPRTIGLWVAVFFTLVIFSFLYRDNPLYKFAESVLIGISAAYAMVVGFWSVVVPNILGKVAPDMVTRWATPGTVLHVDYLYWIPLILGVMLLWRLAPHGGWISRWPLALIIGTTAGLRLIAYMEADFLSQIRNTILPLIVMSGDGTFDLGTSLKNIGIVIGVVSGLVYFFFSVEHKGLVGKVAKVGIWFLMITFGAAFGFTVMGRITLLSQRMEFLFDDWLWIIDPAGKRIGL